MAQQNPLGQGPGRQNPLGGDTPQNPLGGGGNPLAEGQPAPPDNRPAAGQSEGIKLKRSVLQDPMMGGVSHHLLLPEGWTVEGGAHWDGATKPLVSFMMNINAPDGSQMTFRRGASFYYQPVSQQLAAFMQQQGQRPPQPGDRDPRYGIYMPPPQDAAEYVMRALLPQLRPQAQNVRLIENRHWPEMQRHIDEQHAPVRQLFMQTAANVQQVGGRVNHSAVCSVVSVAYTENGVQYREDLPIYLYVYYTMFPPQVQGMDAVENYHWGASLLTGTRAPAGNFEAVKAVQSAVYASIRPDRQWMAKVVDLEMQIAQIEAQGRRMEMQEIIKRGEIMRNTQVQISQMHEQGIAAKNKANDNIHHSFLNAVKGVDDYKVNGNETVSLPNNYNYVYTNDKDEYILFNNTHTLDALDQTKWRPIPQIKLPHPNN